MKPQVKSQQTVKSNGISTSVKFGIKASGLHHILGILRDQLYSDKVLAVVREYSCNAVDAHTEAGVPDKPIEVTMPTRLKLEFKVRDFGPALNDKEIQEVYAFYGESTKRNSNDQIGMLGIGSKSAFAYGDNFVINSYIDGTKHIYNAYIDPSQLGQISKIGTQETKQKNGIEIVVPVKLGDIDEFSEKAQALFQWFKVRPNVSNAKFEYKDNATLFKGNGWRWVNNPDSSRYYKGDAVVVMGNIGYPIDKGNLEFKDDDGLYEMLTANLVLDMPIGDVEISASRENLQYTDYTRKNIYKKLELVKKELTGTIEGQFKDCETLFAAKQLWGTVFDTESSLYSLRNVLKDSLTWKPKSGREKTLSGSDIDCHSGGLQSNQHGNLIELHCFKKGYRASKFRAEADNWIRCKMDTVVIENDLGHRRGCMGRVLDLIVNQGKTVYLIDFKDKRPTAQFKNNTKARKLLKEKGLDCEVQKLSELPKIPLADFGYAANRSGGSAGSTKSSKHSTKEFTLNVEKLQNSGWGDAKSSVWDTTAVDLKNDSGVYVELDRFFIKGGVDTGRYDGENEPRRLNQLRADLKNNLDIDLPTLYGFKINSKALEKVRKSKKWTTLWDWVKTKTAEVIEEKKLSQKYANRTAALSVEQDFNWVCEKLYDNKSFIASLVEGDAKDIFTHIKYMRHDELGKKLDGIQALVSELNISIKLDIEPEHNIAELSQEVNERYSMLQHLRFGQWNWNSKEALPHITNYINIVDVCNSSGV